jgi:TonB family protein
VSRETRNGWIGSLVFHGVLAIVLVLVTVPQIVANEEFIELSWGSAVAPDTDVESAAQEPASSAQGQSADVVRPSSKEKPSQPVVLPDRRLPDLTDEVVGMPRTEKLDVPQAGAPRTVTAPGGAGEKEQGLGKGVGEKEPFAANPNAGVSPSEIASPGSGTLGGDVDRGVAFSIQWMGGGTRKRVTGELPEYPKGTNVEAQIKILAVVQPDGAIKTVQPVQKANTRLEDAAMRAVRQWKFEPLRSGQSQLDQNCVITFLFKLK